jgi:LuxR family maltose regulon positive regulatory protein
VSNQKAFISNINGYHQSSSYLDRPRLRKLFETATNYPLVTIYAGAGYGKTRAVYSYLQQCDAHTTWIQLTERDNVTTRFWENYTHMISLNWPDIGAQLVEIGFPDTDDLYEKYEALRSGTLSSTDKYFLVYDDFHLLHNPTVLRFFERAANGMPPNGTVILISRTIPEVNITGMMLHERVFTIREDELCFTEDEIAEYFNQLSLSVTRQDIRNIYDDTRGWVFAINLIGRSLKKDTKYERYALAAMKENIFRLIEAGTSQIMSKPLWNFLLRISLIDHLAIGLIKILANNDALVKELDMFNAYIRYDYHLGAYMIHHLFLEYLRKNQHILTDEERLDTYQKSGDWCDENGYYMDALSYYGKSGDYGAIARRVGAFNVQMPPDMAKYALELFDNAPDEVKYQDPVFPGMHLRVKINMGQFTEESVALARKYTEIYEARPESPEKNQALAILYANWAFLLMFMCTYTDVYDFDIYYKKMGECYSKNPFKTVGTFNLVPISAWSTLVGTSRAGAQEEFADAMSRSIPATSALGKGFFVGFDDLVRGELFFYRGEFYEAERYLIQSIDKARACDQYVTLSRALVCMMKIAFSRGDFVSATAQLQVMKEMLNENDHGVRYTMYDIAHGFYYLILGQPERIPEWLKADFSPFTHPAFIENYANQVKMLYHYFTRQYSSLLAFIENTRSRQTILLAKIAFKVLEALALYQIKKRDEAIAALTDAYQFAESNKFIIPFTQYGKDMRTLTNSILRDNNCTIPQAWIKDINLKSSAFARRQTFLFAEAKAANGDEDKIELTNRETQVLRDLSQGLSRSEVAACQNISLNTVKMVINTIFDKLCVTSLHDALRIAIVRKLI